MIVNGLKIDEFLPQQEKIYSTAKKNSIEHINNSYITENLV